MIKIRLSGRRKQSDEFDGSYITAGKGVLSMRITITTSAVFAAVFLLAAVLRGHSYQRECCFIPPYLKDSLPRNTISDNGFRCLGVNALRLNLSGST